jgi:NADH dehydrogenase
LDKKRVVIIGAGFGGLRAARNLAYQPVDVVLIDRNNYHLFQPLLYQVATAEISPHEIAHPVRAILRNQRNLQFLLANVTRMDLKSRTIHTSRGDVPFDYLVLAPGGETSYFGNAQLAEKSFSLKSLPDATRLRNQILHQFELAATEADPRIRQKLLTFVVVGGGPTGVESAGALSELVRLVLVKDYPDLDIARVKIILLEAADHLLPGMPDDLSLHTVKVLRKKGVEVRFQAMVEGYDGEVVRLKDGSTIAARTMIWAAGIRSASLLDSLSLPQDRQGRIIVQSTMQVEGMAEVFVIGDAASLPDADGKPLPMVAPVAIQQADTVARNILALENNTALESFTYRDPGSLATIGRNAAVARLGKAKFTGFPAWLVWLFVHLIQLIGFRNRLMVLINWAWDYLFYDRAIRIIGKD